MKEIKSIIGWIAVFIMICFCLFCAWDYVHTKMEDHEKRIAALEAETRPLIIVDKYSDVYLNGEKVYEHDND